MTENAAAAELVDDDDAYDAAVINTAHRVSETLYDDLANAIRQDGINADCITLAVAFLIGRLFVEAEQAGDSYDVIRSHFSGLVDQAVEVIREAEMDEAIVEAADARRRGEKPH